jgi:hypothetical protein
MLIGNFELSLFQFYKLFSSAIKFCTQSLITQNDDKNYRRDKQDLRGMFGLNWPHVTKESQMKNVSEQNVEKMFGSERKI